MSDNNETPPKVSYSSNSNKDKKAQPSDRPALKPIVVGQTRKKSMGSKFRETFAGDDAQTVGQFLLFSVIIPATKNLLFDMVKEGASRMLFGSSPGQAASGAMSSVLGSRTTYNKMFNGAASTVSAPREISAKDRANHNFGDIYLASRGEAELVIDALTSLIDEYSSATVADLYSLVDISPDFPDTKYGWTSMGGADVRQFREGYILILPKPKLLE